MKIVCLMENTSCHEDMEVQHGLSFYIEWQGKKLLFDTGASNRFLKNALKREVDLQKVDTAIISHGHYDHTGGLRGFLEQNERAVVYIREKALEPHFSIRGDSISYIGILETVLETLRDSKMAERIHFTNELEQLAEGEILFSGVRGTYFYSKGNDGLAISNGERYIKDDFAHEQNLILEENGKIVVFSGCSHSGVINIIEACSQLMGREPDFLIGGFHFEKPDKDGKIDQVFIEKIGKQLQTYHTTYYTCHCTRVECYRHLKKQMKDQVHYIGAGDILEI